MAKLDSLEVVKRGNARRHERQQSTGWTGGARALCKGSVEGSTRLCPHSVPIHACVLAGPKSCFSLPEPVFSAVGGADLPLSDCGSQSYRFASRRRLSRISAQSP
eukprot:4868946-Pleurochrysis_carterae.AAC.3